MLHKYLQIVEQIYILLIKNLWIMTDVKSKRRLRINFKLRMCVSLSWYFKTLVSPPVC